MEQEISYYLGIDWGKSWCGVALADSETKVASSYMEVGTGDFFTKLSELAEQFKIEKVIVGTVAAQEGKFSSNITKIEHFVDDLRERGFMVELEEEFFSTQMAQKNLLTVRKKGVSKKDNAESARIILQSWLDKE